MKPKPQLTKDPTKQENPKLRAILRRQVLLRSRIKQTNLILDLASCLAVAALGLRRGVHLLDAALLRREGPKLGQPVWHAELVGQGREQEPTACLLRVLPNADILEL